MRELQQREGNLKKRHLRLVKRRKMLKRIKRARTKRKEKRVKEVRMGPQSSRQVEDRRDQGVGVDGHEAEGVAEGGRGDE